MRGGGGGFNILRGRGTLILAWISWVVAVAGGAAIAVTFIGGLVAGAIGILPSWIAIVAFTLGVVGMILDLVVDGVPNRLAIWMAILLPSVARSVPGKLGASVTHASGQIFSSMNHSLGAWVGTTSTLAVAASLVGIALLVARRVVAKGGM